MIISAFLLGAVAGTVYGLATDNFLTRSSINEYLNTIQNIKEAVSFDSDSLSGGLPTGMPDNSPSGMPDNLLTGMPESFRSNALKHVKTAIIIWLMAFIPLGALPVIGLLFFRGFSYGYTAVMMVTSGNTSGSIYALTLFVPQALLLLPTYFYIALKCLSYIFNGYPRFTASRIVTTSQPTVRESIFFNYLAALVIACTGCVVVGAIDTYLSPMLISLLL